MVMPDARMIAAQMVEFFAFWHWTILNFPGINMGTYCLVTIWMKQAIAFGISSPFQIQQ